MPLSDINPGSALTATDSNDAPLLEFRVKRSGTITPLGVITSIAHEAPDDLLKGQLAFLTNNGATTAPQMLIDQQGNVGIGTQTPEARLHVVGDARFRGPLTILEAGAGPSLGVGGAAAIAGTLSVGGDVAVTGKLKAANIEGDGAGLVNVRPADKTVGSAELKEDAASLGKVSGGMMVVKDGNLGIGAVQPARKLHLSNGTSVEMIMEQADAQADFRRWNFLVGGGSADNPSSFFIRQLDDAGNGGNVPLAIDGTGNVGIGLTSPECRLHVNGVVKLQGPLAVSDKVGIGVSGVGPDAFLDVGSRMRVRQGGSNSAGIWFSQKLREDTAFVGMVDDSRVGFYGSKIGWGLWMRTGPDDAGGGALVEANGRMRIRQGAYHSAGVWFAQNTANKLGFVGMADDDHVGFFGLKDNGGIGWGLTMRTDNGDTDIKGKLTVRKLQLGNKWLLSGDRDWFADDDWLRLANTRVGGYWGGFAAGRLFSVGGTVHGSDSRLKTDISSLGGMIKKLVALRGVRFKWRNAKDEEPYRIGLIAQEVEREIPEVVETGPDGIKGINDSGLIAAIVTAIQELEAELGTLRAEVSLRLNA